MAREGTRRRRGDEAEELVVAFLTQGDLKVLDRNVRVGCLEIDILAREGPILVLVEVRARSRASRTSGFSSVNWVKRRRLRFAADRLWKRRFQFDPTLRHVRFDVASVTLDGDQARLEYVRGAF